MKIVDFISIILFLVLVVLLFYAVQQRFFETSKCEHWVQERLIEVQDGFGEYICNLTCNMSSGLAIELQNDGLAVNPAKPQEALS